MEKYTLIELENIIVTQGLSTSIGKEFSINKNSYQLNDIKLLINFILDYLENEDKTIKDLETFGYGSWIFQFVFNGMYIELHELKTVENGINVYEFDLSNTINIFKEQTAFCLSKNATSDIPKLAQKIAISKEIYEGSEVNGVRYESPSHMSGWYLTSNSYNGDVKSLLVEHLYHILKERPDLAKFLALPAGYRFFKDKEGEDAWFDEQVTT